MAPFCNAAAGYCVLRKQWFPDVYIQGSYLYLASIDVPQLSPHLRLLEPGIGSTISFDLAWLTNARGSFAISYYPVSSVWHKNMSVSWSIYRSVGVVFGGMGIRIPQGRYYSSFIGAIEYAW